MKVIQVKCGSCGAGLNVDEGSDWVTCEYCGTKSRIQRRTGMFSVEDLLGGDAKGPVAVQTPSSGARALIVSLVLIPLLLVGGLVVFLLSDGGSGAHIVAGPDVQWEGVGQAVFADVNGDSMADALGRTRYLGGSDSIHLAAFDARDGKKIWESERLGTYSETYEGKASVVGELVLFGSAQGEVWAYGLKDGKRRWRVPVGEKVKHFCRAEGGLVQVLCTDDKVHGLKLADGTRPGQVERAGEKGNCQALAHDRQEGQVQFRRLERFYPKVDGMQNGKRLQLGADGPILLSGWKSPGTGVPMLAAFDKGRKLLWKTEVPGKDRLKVRNGDVERLSFDEKHAVAVFWPNELNTSARLACFSMADGRRLWENVLPSAMPVSAAQLSDDKVFVSTWGRLTAFALDDGHQLYSIGWSMK